MSKESLAPVKLPPFSVWRKSAWQPFSYNPSVRDAVEMLKCQDERPEDFIIREHGTGNKWDGSGRKLGT